MDIFYMLYDASYILIIVNQFLSTMLSTIFEDNKVLYTLIYTNKWLLCIYLYYVK